MRLSFLLGAAVMTLSVPAQASGLTYPETRKVDVVEDQFGVKVADPYRWLEDDVRVNPDVAKWVEAQNAVSGTYLDKLPGREALKARMKALYDYERFSIPQKAGGHYFFTKNNGLQNQSPLYVRNGLKGQDRVLIDPNGWAKDGATALDQWEPSPDGKRLAYAIQDGGSDWRTIRVIDVGTGVPLGDDIKWAKFTNIAWVGNEGVLYSRFAEPVKGAEFQALNENQTLYYHRIGTPQSDDKPIYATPDRPKLGHSAQVIVTTADTDDRVVPGHSFKYTAALQAAQTGDKPHIILIETRAGHGSGKPTDKLIEEYSDIYGFLAKWTGLELEDDAAK